MDCNKILVMSNYIDKQTACRKLNWNTKFASILPCGESLATHYTFVLFNFHLCLKTHCVLIPTVTFAMHKHIMQNTWVIPIQAWWCMCWRNTVLKSKTLSTMDIHDICKDLQSNCKAMFIINQCSDSAFKGSCLTNWITLQPLKSKGSLLTI